MQRSMPVTKLGCFFVPFRRRLPRDAIMPAVDFRLPGGGLSREELMAALQMAMASGKAVGIEITIYNPRLDEDGSAGRSLADSIAAAAGTAAS
jgi:arginase